MPRSRAAVVMIIMAACAVPVPVVAAPPSADDRDRRIEALEAQVRALTAIVTQMRQTQMQVPAPASPQSLASAAPPPALPASGPAAPRRAPAEVAIAGGKPSIRSTDGRFVVNLHGVMQFDAAGYFQKAAGPIATDLRRGGAASDTAHARDLNSGTNFRRARIGVEGRVFGDFDYNILFEFGGGGAEDAGHIQELWLQYSGLKPLRFRVGAFSPSVGLEDQNSTNGMPFLERPAIADIARSLAGGDYREAAQISAAGSRWFASAAITTRTVGTINSSGSGSSPSFDQNLGGILRVAAIPFEGKDWLVHVGAHGSRVFSVADAGGPDAAGIRYPVQLRERPELRVDGTRLIDTGQIDARHVTEGGLELAGQKGPLYLQGEYERISIERRDSALSDPHFSGWYAEGGLMLTGERRQYNRATFAFDAPLVARPFDPARGGWGALEIVGRYSVADLNYRAGAPGTAPAADAVRGGRQAILAAGLNWYLNPLIRFMIDYQHVKVDRLSPSVAGYMTPVGAGIGQSYDTLSIRSQLAF